MGEHIDRLIKKVELANRVWIPAYPNPDPAGDPIVDAHWRDLGSGGIYDLDPYERAAMRTQSGLPPPPEPLDEEDRKRAEKRAKKEAKRAARDPVGARAAREAVPPPPVGTRFIPPVGQVEDSFVGTGYGPSRREAQKIVVVKTLPRMTAPAVRRMTIEGFAANGYAPTNIVRTTTGKTVITFVRPK